MGIKYDDINEVIRVTESAIGKKIGELFVDERAAKNYSKGHIGHIVEKELYGLKINNNRAPDFEEIGVELKVTGYKWVYSGKKVSAKERLVITMIDYFQDIDKDFYDTHLYNKMRQMLLILYEHEDKVFYLEHLITKYYIYKFSEIPEKDRLIILKDFENIMNKIKNGLAHELSEADTMYLGAAPKGANSQSLRKQPYNKELAMSRAYSLKTTYMTHLFRNHIFHKVESKESLIKDLRQLKSKSIEEIIYQMFEPYKNKTLSEIDVMIGEELERENNKQLARSYISRMLRISKKNFDHIEEFEKANITIKTITLEFNGNLKESMSFPAMDFVAVANETWENSSIKEFFETTKFLFVIFRKTEDGVNNERTFIGSFLWNMSPTTIETHIKKVWMETNAILNNTINIRVKNGYVYNNFPKSTQNEVSHVRTHGKNRAATKKLPPHTKIKVLEDDGSVDLRIFLNGERYSSMCFWLNIPYILNLVNTKLYLDI